MEVVFATAIAALVLAGMFKGYNMSGRRCQFAACSLAANTIAMRQMEQSVAAPWYPAYGISTLLTENGSYSTNLCLPSAQSNVVTCTVNYSATQVSSSPYYAMIQVSCIWTNPNYGGVFTNTLATLRSPN
jgi:hypothetical protein